MNFKICPDEFVVRASSSFSNDIKLSSSICDSPGGVTVMTTTLATVAGHTPPVPRREESLTPITSVTTKFGELNWLPSNVSSIQAYFYLFSSVWDCFFHPYGLTSSLYSPPYGLTSLRPSKIFHQSIYIHPFVIDYVTQVCLLFRYSTWSFTNCTLIFSASLHRAGRF